MGAYACRPPQGLAGRREGLRRWRYRSVTALYEVVLAQPSGDMFQVRLRWADPASGEVRELGRPFNSEELAGSFSEAASELQLAAAAATFAEVLRGDAYAGELLAMIDRTLELRGEGIPR